MVFESLINFQTAKNKPLILVFLGIVYSSLSLVLANWIFPSHASLTTLFFTVLACVPLFMKTIEAEEVLDIKTTSEKSLLKEHGKVILYLCCLFLGFVISFTAWFVLLPVDDAGTNFSVQLDTFCRVNQAGNYDACMGQYGMSSDATGYAIKEQSALFTIIKNNLKVMLVCIIFSFLYGSGALYILTWNAMVLSVAIGYHMKLLLASVNPFSAVLISSVSFLKHGLLEMVGYFIAGLAAGILSVAVIRHHYSTPKFRKILLDSLWLFGLSVLIIIIAGLFEVYL
ncbi:MAG: stage II sporulation protein M [Candidatus Woesearchaeota archaeon]|jgi:uncharacterized membrane protein SpoIIM required for sporulation